MKSWPLVDAAVVQLLSLVRVFAAPWTAARQASLSVTNSLPVEMTFSTCHLHL